MVWAPATGTPYTLVFLTRPKPGVSLADFLDHYQRIHRPLAEQMPGLIEYRQRQILHSGYRGEDAVAYDALSEYIFESEDAARVAFASPEGVAVDDDTGLFIDWDSVLTVPVRNLGQYTRG